jgi:hypothetical protein
LIQNAIWPRHALLAGEFASIKTYTGLYGTDNPPHCHGRGCGFDSCRAGGSIAAEVIGMVNTVLLVSFDFSCHRAFLSKKFAPRTTICTSVDQRYRCFVGRLVLVRSEAEAHACRWLVQMWPTGGGWMLSVRYFRLWARTWEATPGPLDLQGCIHHRGRLCSTRSYSIWTSTTRIIGSGRYPLAAPECPLATYLLDG